MSRTYFHSKDGGAEVRGSERAHAGCLTNDIGIGLLLARCRWGPEFKRLCDSLVGNDYPARDERNLQTMLSVDASRLRFGLADGTQVQVWPVILNTSLRIGSRPLRLLTRLHAQMEIHAWVDGPNREWLAGIIAEGLRDGLMRNKVGWESVIELLRSRSGEGPVVTSYSVCEQFPNAGIADWSPPSNEEIVKAGGVVLEDEEEDWDAWYDIDGDEQWDMAMAALRAKENRLELRPDDFDTYHFGCGITAFDLFERLPEAASSV